MFLDDQLTKGYIRPLISPQTSPMFFVPKKDRKKHMVQDYRYVNEFTIKNNYLLPLISQLVDKLSRIDRFSLGPIGDSKRGRDGSRGGRGSS